MRVFLEGLLPRVLPESVPYRLIPHEGKSDLEKSIPRKLKAWREPGTRFVIVRDQDNADCLAVKAHLDEICSRAGRADAVVRIACRELESWYLADLDAVDHVFGTRWARKKRQKRFRQPDLLMWPSRELKKLVPGFQKIDGARRMGVRVDLRNDRSPSFRHFVDAVERLSKEA